MSSRLRKISLAVLAVVAVFALAACGDSHTRVTTGTYAGESGKNAPYLNVGPLVYEVQLSRELNPANIEDAAYLKGLTPAEAHLAPGQEWFAVFMQVWNHTSAALPAANEHDGLGHPEQHLHADRAETSKTNSPTAAASSRPRANCRCRSPSPARAPPGARCCSTRSRSSRSTTGRWS